jgi:hypothetical protein
VCFGRAGDVADVSLKAARAINIYALGMARHSGGSQQPDEAEEMVAVQVRDKDARDLADLQITFEKLVLRALAAVKEPDLRSLRRAQSHARDVARARRHTGTCSEESYLHEFTPGLRSFQRIYSYIHGLRT